MKPVLAASIAVFREDGKVLIATRTRPPAPGIWSLPGGKVELGETLEQAALRELMEEVGVTASIIGFNRHVEAIGHTSNGALDHHYVVCSFVGAWVAGEAQAGPEAGEVRWIDPPRLKEASSLKELASLKGLATTRNLAEVLAGAHRIWEQSR
jgi:8-oxo-dGTP diphosphatase